MSIQMHISVSTDMCKYKQAKFNDYGKLQN